MSRENLTLQNARRRKESKIARTPAESQALREAHPYNRQGRLLTAGWWIVAACAILVLVYLVLEMWAG